MTALDEQLAMAWIGGVHASDIARVMGCHLGDIAIRRWQLGLPDRDYDRKPLRFATHPMDLDGASVLK